MFIVVIFFLIYGVEVYFKVKTISIFPRLSWYVVRWYVRHACIIPDLLFCDGLNGSKCRKRAIDSKDPQEYQWK